MFRLLAYIDNVHGIVKGGLFWQVSGDILNNLLNGLHNDLSLWCLLKDDI